MWHAARETDPRTHIHTPVSSAVTHPHPHQGGAHKNSCPLHLQKKTPHHHLSTPPPCCFPVEWNNLPPSGNPVWVRGPTFSLLLIVCLEEDVKHTIRHRWLSLPGNVLIQTRWRAAPFSGFVSQMPPLSWSLYGLYLLVFAWSCNILWGLKERQTDRSSVTMLNTA